MPGQGGVSQSFSGENISWHLFVVPPFLLVENMVSLSCTIWFVCHPIPQVVRFYTLQIQRSRTSNLERYPDTQRTISKTTGGFLFLIGLDSSFPLANRTDHTFRELTKPI